MSRFAVLLDELSNLSALQLQELVEGPGHAEQALSLANIAICSVAEPRVN